MCDVYQNGYIKNTAPAATDSNDGLFSERDPLIYFLCPLAELRCRIVVAYPHKTRIQPAKNWLLHERGWVVQERIMPPRTLLLGLYVEQKRRSNVAWCI
jgi:hypothetical protein